MEVETIILALIIIAGIFIVVTLLKTMLKIAAYATGLIFVVILIVGLVVYSDAKRFNELTEDAQKIVVYQDGDEVLAGFSIPQADAFGAQPQAISLHKAILLAKTNESSDLIFVVQKELFMKTQEVTINDVSIDIEEFHTIMESDEPQIPINGYKVENASFVKGILLATIFSQELEEKGTTFILNGIREDTIVIKPDFLSVQVIKLVPNKAFDIAVNETMLGEANEYFQ